MEERRQAFLVIGLYLIIHQFENHLLYPLVVRKIVGISPMVVILALVIGAKLAGFLGEFFSQFRSLPHLWNGSMMSKSTRTRKF
jgi:hypothetical protein